MSAFNTITQKAGYYGNRQFFPRRIHDEKYALIKINFSMVQV